jgi:hypothetical protein
VAEAQRNDELLLTEAWAKAHSKHSVPILSNRESMQYRRLAQWLCYVKGTPSNQRPASVDEPDPLLLQSGPGIDDATDRDRAAAATAPSMDASSQADQPVGRFRDFAAEALRLDPRQVQSATRAEIQAMRRQTSQGTEGSFTPRDEFDPEIFNRQYSGD